MPGDCATNERTIGCRSRWASFILSATALSSSVFRSSCLRRSTHLRRSGLSALDRICPFDVLPRAFAIASSGGPGCVCTTADASAGATRAHDRLRSGHRRARCASRNWLRLGGRNRARGCGWRVGLAERTGGPVGEAGVGAVSEADAAVTTGVVDSKSDGARCCRLVTGNCAGLNTCCYSLDAQEDPSDGGALRVPFRELDSSKPFRNPRARE